MKPRLFLTADFIAESSGGRLLIGSGICAEGASVDTRTIQPKEVFFALKGSRYDGHDFIWQAIEKGAAGVVIEDSRLDQLNDILKKTKGKIFIVTVRDTEKALGDLARAWVQVNSVTVIGVTGSVGKTTTKDLIANVAGCKFKTHATQGNFNNKIGLPLTCLKLKNEHEVLVLEMGMSALGEIRDLCRIAPPTIGVVTCVAPVHLENLKTIEKVAEAKGELVEALPPSGIAVLNLDDERVAQMASLTTAKKLKFGYADGADVKIISSEISEDGHTRIRLKVAGKEITSKLSLFGYHQAYNASAAVAVGIGLGIDPEESLNAIEKVKPGKHRLDIIKVRDVTIIDDCYNASPKTMSSALKLLKEIPAKGRKVAILGDMLELGEYSEEAHIELGRQAYEAGVSILVVVGQYHQFVMRGAKDISTVVSAINVQEAKGIVADYVQGGDVVLIKGSRGVALDLLVDDLVASLSKEEG